MHNFIKFFAAAPIIFLLASCGTSISVKYADKSYSTDTITAAAKIPQLDGLRSTELQNTINDEYMSICTDMLNKFSESAKSTNEQSAFEIQNTEYYNKNNFLSIVTQIDYYAKKTNKSSVRIAKNIDVKNGIELKLSNLFADDSYIDMLNERLDAEISHNSEKYADLWEKPKVSQNQRFYITAQNLVLFYPPYELSYYERGFVEIPVKLSEMSGYLKQEYRFLASE